MNQKNKPHCWGKMTWILKYKDGEEPKTSICNCEHGSMRCKEITRQNEVTNVTHINDITDPEFPEPQLSWES